MQHPCDVKIIFLDIDGVLNCASEYGTVKKKLPNIPGYWLHVPELIERFNKVIEATGAKIVVSSTWRLGETIDSMRTILSAMGVRGELIDLTPNFSTAYSVRGNEIKSWIDANIGRGQFQNYVIIDDDSDMLYWQKDNFVNTNGQVGLTDRDAMKAIRILNTIYQPINWNLL